MRYVEIEFKITEFGSSAVHHTVVSRTIEAEDDKLANAIWADATVMVSQATTAHSRT